MSIVHDRCERCNWPHANRWWIEAKPARWWRKAVVGGIRTQCFNCHLERFEPTDPAAVDGEDA